VATSTTPKQLSGPSFLETACDARSVISENLERKEEEAAAEGSTTGDALLATGVVEEA
jgi:hypothetical protein